MVNGVQTLKPRGVKAQRRREGDPVARASRHAVRLTARFVDGRDHLVERLTAMMERLARCLAGRRC